MPDVALQFLDQSRAYLSSEYLPKIRACMERLSEADVWWRPNSASNSVGHLLLHLAGNLRQWVISGLGGAPDERQRHGEFAPDQQPRAMALLERLAQTVAEADAVLAHIDPAVLQEQRTIQGREVTGMQALYHAVEHFGMHTGQILYITKLRTGSDLPFYEVSNGIVQARWEGRTRDL
jgi:uncharacterized damage-inducible protein DinB